MSFSDILAGFIDVITSTGPNKLDKFIELEKIEVAEELKEEKTTRILAIKKTITSCEENATPMDMNVYHYEYSKNWWKRKYGHFNEELYRSFLDRRAPELH
jgi:hypothetical protein